MVRVRLTFLKRRNRSLCTSGENGEKSWQSAASGGAERVCALGELVKSVFLTPACARVACPWGALGCGLYVQWLLQVLLPICRHTVSWEPRRSTEPCRGKPTMWMFSGFDMQWKPCSVPCPKPCTQFQEIPGPVNFSLPLSFYSTLCLVANTWLQSMDFNRKTLTGCFFWNSLRSTVGSSPNTSSLTITSLYTSFGLNKVPHFFWDL